jgi:hypothetical protein
MSNYGYIHSKTPFKKDELRNHLNNINIRRFKGLLEIIELDNGWTIQYSNPYDSIYFLGFDLFIKSDYELEHGHEFGWAFYLEIVFSHELATIYNGQLSDDYDLEDVREPNVNKYPTYQSWLNVRTSHIKDVVLKNKIISELELEAPELLKDC